MSQLFSASGDGATIDLLTVLSIGVLAYLIAVAAHEVLGHATTCVCAGGRVLSLNTLGCECDATRISRRRERVVEASGTVVNLFLGAAALVALRAVPDLPATWRYFLLLSLLVNVFLGAGYLMVSPHFNFGDWSLFLVGLHSPTRWKIGLSAAGLAVSLLALLLGVSELEPFCGAADPLRGQRARLLTLVPYLGGCVVVCLMALLNPEARSRFLLASIGIFGGTVWLAWTGFLIGTAAPSAAAIALGVPRDAGFIGAAVVALALYAAVLGRGLRFADRRR
jgi:hypothetical protein